MQVESKSKILVSCPKDLHFLPALLQNVVYCEKTNTHSVDLSFFPFYSVAESFKRRNFTSCNKSIKIFPGQVPLYLISNNVNLYTSRDVQV